MQSAIALFMLGAGLVDAKTRTYFIAAEEGPWDYCAGSKMDQMMHIPLAEHPHAATFTERGDTRIGCEYIKARYVRYTDASFTQRAERPADESHMALLGPVIRAEVGDQIRVNFLNRASFPVSIHPHGVAYTKANEGMMDHMQDPKDMGDDAVSPGSNYTYEWDVPETAGPTPTQPSSIVWLYHDHHDEVAGPYAGLVGTIIVTRKGSADDDAKPVDVDRELVLFFSVMNEGGSSLFETNVQHYLNASGQMQQSDYDALTKDGDFEESNLMHGVNGVMYGNLEGLTVKQNQRVRWHTVALGTEVDMHSVHWHGNTLDFEGKRTDVVELLPASMKTADMLAVAPGRWFLECHVADHVLGGMYVYYTVEACKAGCSKALATQPSPVDSIKNELKQIDEKIKKMSYTNGATTSVDSIKAELRNELVNLNKVRGTTRTHARRHTHTHAYPHAHIHTHYRTA
jgi:FtsP/CotA-like multicopper oxidase with cupredoxin domain